MVLFDPCGTQEHGLPMIRKIPQFEICQNPNFHVFQNFHTWNRMQKMAIESVSKRFGSGQIIASLKARPNGQN